MVRFRAGSWQYAVPVEVAREVRRAAGLLPLPTPTPGVAGVLEDGDGVLTVLSTLGGEGKHVLVLESDGDRLGLLVEEVMGILKVESAQLGRAPAGQAEDTVAGVVTVDGEMVMILDAQRLAQRLAQ
jgi:chemotaxis signal transduction protein